MHKIYKAGKFRGLQNNFRHNFFIEENQTKIFECRILRWNLWKIIVQEILYDDKFYERRAIFEAYMGILGSCQKPIGCPS